MVGRILYAGGPRHFFLHSIASLRRVAGSARMEIAKIVHDSGSLQFFGSELYLRDIPLQPVVPSEVAARAAAFTQSELEVFERQAQTLNAEGRGDQAAFYLKRAPSLRGRPERADPGGAPHAEPGLAGSDAGAPRPRVHTP